jgi:hypothetical protein
VGGVLALVALVIVVVALQLPSGGAGGGATDGPNPTASGGPDPTATEEPTPTPPAEPSPVPIDEPATITPGLTAAIGSLEAVQGEARRPGEVAGPAIRFEVSIRNATSDAVDLGTTVVTVDYGADRAPALQLTEPGGRPLPASVAPGETATAVYIFTVPVDQRGVVHITVDYALGVPPLEFTGPAPVA